MLQLALSRVDVLLAGLFDVFGRFRRGLGTSASESQAERAQAERTQSVERQACKSKSLRLHE
jgi:hypothetical protein